MSFRTSTEISSDRQVVFEFAAEYSDRQGRLGGDAHGRGFAAGQTGDPIRHDS